MEIVYGHGHFFATECKGYLGMESGQIKDSQLTASSSKPECPPQNGRLHLDGNCGFCFNRTIDDANNVVHGECWICV